MGIASDCLFKGDRSFSHPIEKRGDERKIRATSLVHDYAISISIGREQDMVKRDHIGEMKGSDIT